jgi:hypothetical protein
VLTTKAMAWAVLALAIVALSSWLVWRWMYRTVPGDHHEIVLARLREHNGRSRVR